MFPRTLLMSLRFGPSVRFQFHVKGSSSTSPNPISRSFSDNIVPRTAAYLCSTTPFTRPANDTLSRFQKGNERSIQPPALLEFPSRFNGSTQRRLLASLTSTSPGRDDDGSWDDDRVTDEDDASRGETTIEIRESDLEEQFVRGSGPGGQKINKSSVCVETRSQMKNRELARKLLQRKLEEIALGEQSEAARELSKARARKAKRRRKSIKKHFKSRRDRMLLDS